MNSNPQPFHALLIGINRYLSPQIPTLRGCVNDVEALAQLLSDKFQAATITKLIDQQATHEAIKQAFRETLIEPAQLWSDSGCPGEPPVFLFHYSGHGSRALNKAKAEGFDESIVPHDSRMGEGFDIRDWELGKLLDELTRYAANVTVIMDCCHSGSGTRASEPGEARPGVRSCPPDMRIQPGLPGAKPVTRAASKREIPYVLLAACRNFEEANEYRAQSQSYGALTYHVTQALAAMSRPLTYQELHEKLLPAFKKIYGAKQVPQCEGDRKRLIFGGIKPVLDPLLTVTERRDGFFWINGGLAHGLMEGSELQVHPAATRAVADAGPPLATLKVRQAGGTQSACTLLDGSADFELPAKATISRRSNRHGVFIHSADPQLRQIFTQGIEQGEFGVELELAELPDQADWIVAETAAGVEIQDRRGNTVIPARPKSRAYPLLAGLRHISRYRNALDLRNPDQTSEVAQSLKVAVKKLAIEQGEAKALDLPLQDGLPLLQESDKMVVEARNQGDQPLYFAIFDFSDDYSISQMYPEVKGSRDRLAPDTVFAFGLSKRRDQQVQYSLSNPAHSQARVTVKVIAAAQETEFESFEQGSLEQAMSGSGKRGMKRGGGQEDDWATAQVEYWVAR